MKKICFIFLLAGSLLFVHGADAVGNVSGKILLQVHANGEAWYVNPATERRYFLGRPHDAFDIMRLSGVGITNNNLNKIPVAEISLKLLSETDTDQDGFSDKLELESSYNPYGEGVFVIDSDFASKQKGKIFLAVEANGEAWYVNPDDGLRYYLGRPQDAFDIMRNLGTGITNSDLEYVLEGNINNLHNEISPVKTFATAMSFAPQAPFGNWADPRQEDGCEEASALMAVYWALGKTLTPSIALDEILAISQFELDQYGSYNDTSAIDTGKRILAGYFDYHNYLYKENIAKNDIISELEKGNVVIVPIDGRIVGNPYYTAPGPVRHMLVIKSYDRGNKAFITNDPGTKRGENFVYNEDVLFSAIGDYPSGVHPPRTVENQKSMLVVWR